jgi:hypothetical protein
MAQRLGCSAAQEAAEAAAAEAAAAAAATAAAATAAAAARAQAALLLRLEQGGLSTPLQGTGSSSSTTTATAATGAAGVANAPQTSSTAARPAAAPIATATTTTAAASTTTSRTAAAAMPLSRHAAPSAEDAQLDAELATRGVWEQWIYQHHPLVDTGGASHPQGPLPPAHYRSGGSGVYAQRDADRVAARPPPYAPSEHWQQQQQQQQQYFSSADAEALKYSRERHWSVPPSAPAAPLSRAQQQQRAAIAAAAVSSVLNGYTDAASRARADRRRATEQVMYSIFHY